MAQTDRIARPQWLRDMLAKDWREQDRVPAGVPEGGQFGSGGGGSNAGGGGGPPSPPPSGQARPRVEAKGSDVSSETTRRINSAVNAIPAAHGQKLKDIPISVFQSNDSPGFSIRGAGGSIGAEGSFRYNEKERKAIGIVLAESKAYSYNEYSGNQLVGQKIGHAKLEELEKTTVHELGHALDFQEGDGWGHSSTRDYKNDFHKGWKRLTAKEQKSVRSYFVDSKESFAELYSFLYNPNKSDTYFRGTMKRSAVEKKFPEVLARIRAI